MAQVLTKFVVLTVISLSVAVSVPLPVKPNIVFVLVDDWGFTDVGFRNPKVKTPNFDDLAKTGLVLNRHYVYMYCSPSRASLLTGRWPHHAHQWNQPQRALVGANINMTMLPAKLKQAGYSTHMVGKWHLGFFDPAYLPVSRGFDTSSGFLYGVEDHMTEIQGCAVDYWKNKAPDTRNGMYDSYTHIALMSLKLLRNMTHLSLSFSIFHYTMFMDLFKHLRNGLIYIPRDQLVTFIVHTKPWLVLLIM